MWRQTRGLSWFGVALAVAAVGACGSEEGPLGELRLTQLVRDSSADEITTLCQTLLDAQQEAIAAGRCPAGTASMPLDWCVVSLHAQAGCPSTIGEYYECATEDACLWPVVVFQPQLTANEHCKLENTCFNQRGVQALAASAEGVGEPCLPEQVPTAGFDAAEVYLESNSLDCRSAACMVSGLAGDPRPDCAAGGSAPCAAATEVAAKVYCSCRCATDDPGLGVCTCPAGFSCQSVTVGESYCGR